MKRLASAVLVFFVTLGLSLTPVPVDASKGSTSGGTKTVDVKGYTKKDGTHVEAHDRKAPATKAEKAGKKPATTAAATTPPVTAARDSHGRILRSGAAKHAFEGRPVIRTAGRATSSITSGP